MKLDFAGDFKTRRFWNRFVVHGFASVGALVTLIELYSIIIPVSGTKRSGFVVVGVVCISAGYGLWRAWPRPVEESYTKPNTKIRIVVGDLFTQQANLVIGMATSFDTEVPHVIQRNSVQGQFLERVYNNDVAALNNDIDSLLVGVTSTRTVAKPGKQEIYPVGTVLPIRHQRKFYFCVAYTELDANNQAQGTIDGLWQSLSNLWTEVRSKSNGDPVAIPVIGGGLSRMSQVLPAQDSIRLTILSYMFASRHTAVSERLDIVVMPEAVKTLDMPELQAFLRSLKES